NPDDYYGEDCMTILINGGYWNDDNCFMTAVVCEDTSAVLHCPSESVINIQSAFFGRKSPHRNMCDNRPFCFALAYVEDDPCPSVSKYLEIVYSCEQRAQYGWSRLD
uniref:SUEL-type lectin domain-containing protein n=1 Tax=Mola mola TaxID=94237 RepID=A0A3Q3VUN5_MOLML